MNVGGVGHFHMVFMLREYLNGGVGGVVFFQTLAAPQQPILPKVTPVGNHCDQQLSNMLELD